MQDPVSRRSRGFGFVTFLDACSVESALKTSNHTIDEREVDAKRAVPRGAPSGNNSKTAVPKTISKSPSNPSNNLRPRTANEFTNAQLYRKKREESGEISPTKKLFIGGLHFATGDDEFAQYFESFGKIVFSQVVYNRETRKSRGFGFLIYVSKSGRGE